MYTNSDLHDMCVKETIPQLNYTCDSWKLPHMGCEITILGMFFSQGEGDPNWTKALKNLPTLGFFQHSGYPLSLSAAVMHC